MNIRQVQVSVRSLSNLSGFTEGQDVSPFDVQGALMGPGAYIETTPTCPSSGAYTFGSNLIPASGDLYVTCSLAASDRHVPDDYSGWKLSPSGTGSFPDFSSPFRAGRS